jgi:MFS family permease
VTAADRDLRLLAVAVGVSAAGDLAALTALALVVHEATGSGLAVAALLTAVTGPIVLLAPAAGLLVDRVETRRVLLGAALVSALAAGALACVSAFPAILALAVVLGAGGAVLSPAEFALLPAVAGDDERLARANAWVEGARSAGLVGGPLIVVGLASLGGTRLALAVDAASFLAVALMALALRTRRPPAPARPGDRARDGFAVLLGDPVLRPTLIAAVAGLLTISASWSIDVFYIKDVVGAGDAGYAIAVVAWTAGMLAGAVGLAGRFDRGDLATGALLALAAQGGGMVLGASWAILGAVVAGFIAGGIAHGIKNVLLRLLLQRRVHAALHGRAFAAYNAMRNAAEIAAIGAGGVLVGVLGAQAALGLAGAGAVVAGLAGAAALRTSARTSRTRPASLRTPLPASTGPAGPP